MKKLLFWACWLAACALYAQPVSLSSCEQAAKAQYPLWKQQQVASAQGSLQAAIWERLRWLPQLSLNGQGTWQSEVTRLPIENPMFSVPTVSQDQYKLTLDASLPLYDGGQTKGQVRWQEALTQASLEQVEVEWQRWRPQITLLYFQVLLADEQIGLNHLLAKDLESRSQKMEAAWREGTAARMQTEILQAESLKVAQRLAELAAQSRGLRQAMALLTGLAIHDSTEFEVPDAPVPTTTPKRPELRLFAAQIAVQQAQSDLLSAKIAPRISLFGQGGYGRPGLNMLDNSFREYFIGGLRLNWNISAFYTHRQERQLFELQRQSIQHQQATFEQQLAFQLRQQQTEADKYQAQFAQAAQILALRQRLTQAAAAQLDNGIITARDYTTELLLEHQARQQERLLYLQWLMALQQYQTLTGN